MAQRGVDLKDEDEVTEYLERLGVEYRFGCYYEKNGKGIYPVAQTNNPTINV